LLILYKQRRSLRFTGKFNFVGGRNYWQMVVELRTVSGRIVRNERAAKAVTSAGQRGLNTGDRRRDRPIEHDHPAKRGLGGGQEGTIT
jgi:hypothetical protein